MLVGEMFEVVAVILFTVNVCAFDVPPPGVGLKTVTLYVPAESKSVARMFATNFVALINVVVLSDPFTRTTEVETKFVPFTVSVNAASPTFLLDGEMLVVVGVRLFTVRV